MKSIENKLEKYLGLQKSIQQKNEDAINKALNTVLIQNGPIHINCPFNEPLYDMVDELSVNPKEIAVGVPEVIEEDLTPFIKIWNSAKRKLILVGVQAPNTVEQQYLDVLANDESVIVLTETTSNCHHKQFFPSIDKLIAPLNSSEFEALQPDLIITFGGLIVSKKIKQFLREYKSKHHWHIGENTANDTFFVLNKVFKMPINHFFSTFLNRVEAVSSNYQPYWQEKMNLRREKHKDYLKEIPFSDFKVFDYILKSIPNNSLFQVSNSSAIRYIQLFDVNKTLQVFCNRGTSGIDGSTSTAIGTASVVEKQTVFVTGDLSFFYDSNALWNQYIPKSFRIILINNSGGGIFRILPGHKNTPNFDAFFETKHNLNAKALCEMYGFNYEHTQNEDELETALVSFYSESDEPKLLEIFTPSEKNDDILLQYFKYIK